MKFAIMLFVTLALASCGEGETPISHGYVYVSFGYDAAIADGSGRMVVEPNVTRYRVLGPYIAGERVQAKRDDNYSPNFGYFLLDMRNGSYTEGLDEKAFETTVKAKGLEEHPFRLFSRLF